MSEPKPTKLRQIILEEIDAVLEEKDIAKPTGFEDRLRGAKSIAQSIYSGISGRWFNDYAQNIIVLAWEKYQPVSVKKALPRWLSKLVPLGHAGVAYVLPDRSLHYAEFGAYGKAIALGKGIGRTQRLMGRGSVKYDKKGKITNWNQVKRAIKRSRLMRDGFKSGQATAAILTGGDTKAMHSWVKSNVKIDDYGLLANTPFNLPIAKSRIAKKVIGGHNCASWVADALKAGDAGGFDVSFRKLFLTSPSSIVTAAVNDTDEFITRI